MNRNKKVKYLLISTIAVVLVAAILVTLIVIDHKHGIFPEREQEKKIFEYNGVTYKLKNGIETFLVLGLDKYDESISSEPDSYNNNQQSDFLMLMVFDNRAKTYSTVHINRDTMVEMDVLGLGGGKVGTATKQIALAHTYGKGGTVSNSNAARAVSNLLCGVKVNHSMSFTLDSVGVMNELVGGVTLEVLDDFTGVEGGEGLVKGETVTLTNEQALLYVQHRRELDDSSNATRMQRQRQYLEIMRTEIERCIEEDSEFLKNAVLKMKDYMSSDSTTARLQDIGKRLQEYEFVEITDIEGESIVGKSGKMEFYPNEDSLKQLVIDLFYIPKN